MSRTGSQEKVEWSFDKWRSEMKSFLVAVCGALAFPASSSPPDVPRSMADCRTIEDNLLRLRCYDDVALPSGEAVDPAAEVEAPAAGTRTSGGWTIEERVNPIDDSTTVVALVPATVAHGQQLPGTVELYIRCQSGQTDAFVAWSSIVGQRATVVTRFDKQKPESRSWMISTDMRSTFYPGGASSFIARLATATTLAAEVSPSIGSRVSATFDLSGAQEAVQAVRKACRW